MAALGRVLDGGHGPHARSRRHGDDLRVRRRGVPGARVTVADALIATADGPNRSRERAGEADGRRAIFRAHPCSMTSPRPSWPARRSSSTSAAATASGASRRASASTAISTSCARRSATDSTARCSIRSIRSSARSSASTSTCTTSSAAARSHRIVYASNHKSHTDYLVEPLVLDDNGIRPPLIAAGINLFGGPLGLIHRHVTGAIPDPPQHQGPGVPDHAQGVRRRDAEEARSVLLSRRRPQLQRRAEAGEDRPDSRGARPRTAATWSSSRPRSPTTSCSRITSSRASA